MSDKIEQPFVVTSQTGLGQHKLTLHFETLEAMQNYRDALAQQPAQSAMPTEAELIAIAERLGAVGELCVPEDHPDMIWRIRIEVQEMVREVLKTYSAPAAEQPYSTTSDRYRAELYDEVWKKARGLGFGNVTMALAELEAVRSILTDDDMRRLRRFQEICEDSDADGHDLPKEAVRRLERAGALRSCGFGRHEITAFGDHLLGKEGEA